MSRKISILDPRRFQGLPFHTGVSRSWDSIKANSLVCMSEYPDMHKETDFSVKLLTQFACDTLGLYISPLEVKKKYRKELVNQLAKPSILKKEYFVLFDANQRYITNIIDCLSKYGLYENWFIVCMKSTDTQKVLDEVDLEHFSDEQVSPFGNFYERTDLFSLVLYWNLDYGQWTMIYNDQTRFDEMIEVIQRWNSGNQ